eukprot:scaffold13603_cov112-Isochrysis_galbana.AAC.12
MSQPLGQCEPELVGAEGMDDGPRALRQSASRRRPVPRRRLHCCELLLGGGEVPLCPAPRVRLLRLATPAIVPTIRKARGWPKPVTVALPVAGVHHDLPAGRHPQLLPRRLQPRAECIGLVPLAAVRLGPHQHQASPLYRQQQRHRLGVPAQIRPRAPAQRHEPRVRRLARQASLPPSSGAGSHAAGPAHLHTRCHHRPGCGGVDAAVGQLEGEHVRRLALPQVQVAGGQQRLQRARVDGQGFRVRIGSLGRAPQGVQALPPPQVDDGCVPFRAKECIVDAKRPVRQRQS